MDTDYTTNAITTMQHHLDAANKYLTELAKGYRSSEKQNTLLDAAMKQVELCCIDMRNLCEKVRPTIPPSPIRCYNHTIRMHSSPAMLRKTSLHISPAIRERGN